MTLTLYRWQDRTGRGPYRIGVSRFWKDVDHEARNPALQDEFGWDVYTKIGKREHLGCGFRSIEQMHQWFTLDEQARLALMGYEFVRMEVDRVVAESPRQVLFARRRPLRFGAQVMRAEVPA